MNYGIYNPNYGFPDSLSFGMKRLFAARPHPCYGLYLSLDSQTSKTRDIRLAVPLGIFLLKNTEKSSDQAELPALNTQNDFLEYELLVFFQSELVIHMENKLQTWFKSHEGADWAILYLRLFIGTIILLHNVGKMQAYNEIINYYPSWGIFGSAFIFVAIARSKCCAPFRSCWATKSACPPRSWPPVCSSRCYSSSPAKDSEPPNCCSSIWESR